MVWRPDESSDMRPCKEDSHRYDRGSNAEDIAENHHIFSEECHELRAHQKLGVNFKVGHPRRAGTPSPRLLHQLTEDSRPAYVILPL